MPNDLGDQLKKDYEKYQRLQEVGEGDGLGLGAKMEYTFWGLAVLSVVGMMVSMLFVGPDKPITGEVWLTASLGSIAAFSSLALAVRQLPEV